MRRLILTLLLWGLAAQPVFAQLRPGAFTTLTVTDTGATALKVGCAVGVAPPCTGTVTAGPIVGSQVTVNSVGIINTSGKIPAITSTYFTALAFDAANLAGTIASATQDLITRTGTVTSGTWGGAFSDAALTAIDAGTWTGASSITTLGTIATGTWNAAFSDAALTAIDAGTWTGAASLTTLGTITAGIWNAGAVTSSGLATFNGFGTHAFSAGGTGTQVLSLRNTTSGTTMAARLSIGNNTSATAFNLYHLSSAYTTIGYDIASASIIEATEAGGLSIVAYHGSGAVRFYSGGATLRAQINTNGTQTWAPYGAGTATFDASGNITSATTLSASTTGSSLTSVGTITTGVWNAGAVTSSGAVLAAAGSAAAPAYSFTEDTNAGFYRFGTDTISVAAAGSEVVRFSGGLSQIELPSAALGDPGIGRGIFLGRNSSGIGAAGWVEFVDKAGAGNWMWVDATGDARISTGGPPDADGGPTDTSGAVVGDQTSSLDRKFLGAAFTDNAGALAEVLRTPLYRFTYRSGSYNGQEFVGLVTDFSPIFGKDRDAEHPGGKSLNEITLNGYLIASIKALNARIAALEQERRH